jgi:hypothetical protein
MPVIEQVATTVGGPLRLLEHILRELTGVLTRRRDRDHARDASDRCRWTAAARPIPPDPAQEAPVSTPTRESIRRSIADRLLTSLEDLVQRHRALSLHTPDAALHAELIAAEVAHELAVARSALHRHPPMR